MRFFRKKKKVVEDQSIETLYSRHEKWRFNPDTDVMVASKHYNRIYLKKTSWNMVWWVIQSNVDDYSFMVMRDKDFHDLKEIFEWLINREPNRISSRFMEMKHK